MGLIRLPAGRAATSRRVPWLLLAVLLATAAGCTAPPSSGTPDTSPRSPTPTAGPSTHPAPVSRYVALGDSYTAGPLIPTTRLAAGCLRSDHNYAALLARRLGADHLADVSCSGARTHDLAHPQHTIRTTTVPPQLGALDPRTQLVTLGIGGNDFGLFQTLVRTCTGLRPSDPTGAPCRRRLDRTGDVHEHLQAVGRRLDQALGAVRRRAPHARVVLVGYPRLAPRHGTCPDLLPLADGDYATADRLTRSLRDVMRRAAHRAHVSFVDMYAASRGHDVCAAHPWVNGVTTDRSAALAFHPFLAEMRAVADRVTRLLHRSRSGPQDRPSD